MLQALVLTAAILMTIWSLMDWFVFSYDFYYWNGSKPSTLKMNLMPTVISIFLWVIYCHL